MVQRASSAQQEGTMDRSVVLSVGDGLRLGLFKGSITYAGMPSDGVYSIVHKKGYGYRGFAWNLFYPSGKSELMIDGVRIYVENATPDEIRLRIG
jgi:hypothetical protein